MQLIDGRPVYAATDLVGFLACSHRLALERAALAGLVEKPIRNDPSIELIARRGEAHFATKELGAAGTGLAYHVLKPDKRQAFGHRHDEAEEVVVILSGSGSVRVATASTR